VMLTSDGTDVLKIADFGASKDASINSLPKTQVGTISYMAPEVTNVNKKESESSYGAGADIWSLGVILYVLVCCKYPFGFDGPKRHGGIQAHKVYENIRKGADAVDFPESISPELVELLRGIFTVKVPSPEQAASADAGGSAVAGDEPVRWTLTQIRESAWLQVGDHYAPTVVEEELIAEIFWCVRCRGAAALHVPCACSCDS
jgi:serine/threonine protein kinase